MSDPLQALRGLSTVEQSRALELVELDRQGRVCVRGDSVKAVIDKHHEAP